MHSCQLPFEISFKHRDERSHYSLEPFEKLLVKSPQPNKLSDFIDGGRCRLIPNDLDLFVVHVYSIVIDDISAKRNSRKYLVS